MTSGPVPSDGGGQTPADVAADERAAPLLAPAEVDRTIGLYEERAVVGKRRVGTGRVRVTTATDVVEETVGATLRGEAVEVTRVAVNQPVVGPVPQVRTEGAVTIVPVFEEVLVVEKRLMLKEELHIRRRDTEDHVETPVTVRRQRATIERFDEAEDDRRS